VEGFVGLVCVAGRLMTGKAVVRTKSEVLKYRRYLNAEPSLTRAVTRRARPGFVVGNISVGKGNNMRTCGQGS
jgi:hypothetical protein